MYCDGVWRLAATENCSSACRLLPIRAVMLRLPANRAGCLPWQGQVVHVEGIHESSHFQITNIAECTAGGRTCASRISAGIQRRLVASATACTGENRGCPFHLRAIRLKVVRRVYPELCCRRRATFGLILRASEVRCRIESEVHSISAPEVIEQAAVSGTAEEDCRSHCSMKDQEDTPR